MYRTTWPTWVIGGLLLFWANSISMATSEIITLQPALQPISIDLYNMTEFEMTVQVTSNTSYSRVFTVNKEMNPYNHTMAIFQAHSLYNNVTVSSTSIPRLDSAVTSTGGGVLMLYGDTRADDLVWYVNATAPPDFDFTILIAAIPYTITDPIPGACNMVFDLENDPNIYLTYDRFTNYLEFQPANVGFSYDELAPPCDVPPEMGHPPIKFRLTYDLYMYYLPESDLSEGSLLEGLGKMNRVEDIVKYGSKMATLSNTDKTQFTVSSREGQGSIYNIVVRDPEFGTRASYVPTHTYSCQFSSSTNTCSISDRSVIAKVFTTLIGLAGIFLCFFGHRFFKTEVAMFGCITFGLAFTMILMVIGNVSTVSYYVAIPVLGMLGGALALCLWWFCGHWVLTVLFVSLNLGYLFACTIFFTPFGELDVWDSNLTFGMCFACFLMIPFLFIYYGKALNILSCVVVGGYMVVIGIDSYLQTSLSYIVINNINRASVPGFNVVYTTVPFQTDDWILAGIWIFLAILGASFQWWRERRQPRFPPCPYTQWKKRHSDQSDRTLTHLAEERGETTPLLH